MACADSPGRTDSPQRRAQERRVGVIIATLALIVVSASVASFLLGRYPIEPHEVVSLLASRIVPVEQFWTDQQATIFFNVRLPRVILALLVGCCLSAAGAAYQGTFQNPLVSPDILGASQGAALGAAIAILMGLPSLGISLMAFAFSIATVATVMLVSSIARGDHMLTVVLAGIMMSSLATAGVSFAKLVADPSDQLPAITYWLMGSLTGAKQSDLAMALPPMVVGIAVLFLLRWRINVLTMGDEESETLGVSVRLLRTTIIAAATLVTAACVAVTGMIGWVGLVIPHLARMMVGPDYRALLPASMLLGSGFLLIVDDASRLMSTAEIPIGILTAFIGAPFFLYLIVRAGRGSRQ